MSTAWATEQLPGGFDLLPDRHSFDVLERDVMVRAVLTDAVDSRDVLVIELRGGAPLLVEARDDFGIAGLIRGQKLERDLTVELGVERSKNRPHAADADGFFDQERVDKVARHGQGGRCGNRGYRAGGPPACRAARSTMNRRRLVRSGHVTRIDSWFHFGTRSGGHCILTWCGRLGDQHRLALKSSGLVPWQHFLAVRS